MYDDIITLYNIIDGVGYRTVIKGVHTEPNTGIAIEETGLKESDTFLCIIPEEVVNKLDKKYVNWKQFKNMSNEERQGYFTFKNGDKIVNCETDFEITNVKPNTIADLERNYVDVYTITNYAYKKITNSKLNHYEINGK